MYGIVNHGVQSLVVERFGEEVWNRIAERAKLEVADFEANCPYADDITFALVTAASLELSTPSDDLLRVLGEGWMDYTTSQGHAGLLELTGDNFVTFLASLDSMHEAVGVKFPELVPPTIWVSESTDEYLLVNYLSMREGLDAFMEGMLYSIANRFCVPIEVEHRQAVTDGHEHDQYTVRRRYPGTSFTGSPEDNAAALSAANAAPSIPQQLTSQTAPDGSPLSQGKAPGESSPEGSAEDSSASEGSAGQVACLQAQLKQVQEQFQATAAGLDAATKMASIGELASGIAHEINTPIQFVGDNLGFIHDVINDLGDLVNGFIQAAGAEPGPDRDAQLSKALAACKDLDVPYLLSDGPRAVQESQEGISRVSELVRAMKAFAHSDDEMRQADLNECIKTTLVVARSEYKYLAELHTQFAEDLPQVPCFVGEVNQVILNLVVNAAHAIEERLGPDSTERGTITVRTSVQDGHAVIEIADDGMGIPESAQPRIFERFFTTKEVGRGTGQGLAVSYEIVTQHHHGSLTFTTQRGVGTTFRIALPLEQDEAN